MPVAVGSQRISPSAPMPVCRAESATTCSSVDRFASEQHQEVVAVGVKLLEPHVVSQSRAATRQVRLVSAGRSRGRRRPMDAGIAPEPRALPPREPAGVVDHLDAAFVERSSELDVVEHLLVAEALPAAPGEPAGRRGEAPHLFDKSLSDIVPTRCSMRSSSHSLRRPQPDDATIVGCPDSARRRARTTRTARRCPMQTSRARMTRRRFVGSIRVAATGSSSPRRGGVAPSARRSPPARRAPQGTSRAGRSRRRGLGRRARCRRRREHAGSGPRCRRSRLGRPRASPTTWRRSSDRTGR